MAGLPDTLYIDELELRRWRPEDVDRLVESIAASLPELKPWMAWAQNVPEREAQLAVIEEMAAAFEAGTMYAFGLYERGGDVVAGGAGLHLDRPPAPAEIGYWVRSDRHRKGYATRASECLTSVAFAELGVTEVHITMDAANAASAAVPAKLGYELVAGTNAHPAEARDPVTPGHTGEGLRWVMTRARWQARA